MPEDNLTQPGVRIDSVLWQRFRDDVQNRHGGIRGYLRDDLETAIREWLDETPERRLNDIVDDLESVVAELDDDGATPDSTDAMKEKEDSPGSRTEARLSDIMAELRTRSEDYAISAIREDDIRRAIQDNAGSSHPTIRKYRNLLVDQRYLFPNPNNDDEYFTKPTAFIAFMEQNRQQFDDDHYWTVRNNYGEEWWTDHAPDGLLNTNTRGGFQ